MTQGRSILLFGIWLTVAGAGPSVCLASAPADTTAQVTTILTGADPVAREVAQLHVIKHSLSQWGHHTTPCL